MILETLDISGEILIKFNLEVKGDSTKRRVPDEELECYIKNYIIQSMEDEDIMVDDARVYNFDIYKSRKEEEN